MKTTRLIKLTAIFFFFLFQKGTAHDKFLIHSIPKCGSHFLQKTITELTGKPAIAKDASLQEKLNDADKGEIIPRFHSPFNLQFAEMIQLRNCKLISIYRDPRDALISLVIYMRTFKGKGVHRDFFQVVPNFDELPFNQQLLSVMTSKNKAGNYFHYYFSRINWHRLPFAYGVKYENLVGARGGGDDLLQVQEILNMAEHIHLPITLEQAKQVASNIYQCKGQTPVEGKIFVHGQIGSWKIFMNPQHKEIFKHSFGDLLIKLGYEKNDRW